MLVFADNDSASQVVTKRGSTRPLINHHVGPFRFLEARDSKSVCLGRVRSASNPADAPSRGAHRAQEKGRLKNLVKVDGRRVKERLSPVERRLKEFGRRWDRLASRGVV